MLLWSVMACSVTVNGDERGFDLSFGGPMVEEPRELPAFHGVRAASGVDVVVHVAEGPQEVMVHAHEKDLPSILTDVVDGVLVVGSGSGVFSRRRVELRVPALDIAELTSTGDVDVDGLAGGSLRVRVAGSGDLELEGTVDALDVSAESTGDVDAEQLAGTAVVLRSDGSGGVELGGRVVSLDVQLGSVGSATVEGVDGPVKATIDGSGDLSVAGRITALDANLTSVGDLFATGVDAEQVSISVGGSGDAELEGRADRLALEVRSVGDVDASELELRDADVRSTGSGDVMVHATGVVSGQLSSVGDLTVEGGAAVNVRATGTGDVRVD